MCVCRFYIPVLPLRDGSELPHDDEAVAGPPPEGDAGGKAKAWARVGSWLLSPQSLQVGADPLGQQVGPGVIATKSDGTIQLG